MIISFTQRKTELEMDDATSLIQFSRNTPVSVRLSDNTYLSNTDIPHPNYRYALTWQDKNRINVAKTDLEYDEGAELYYGKIGKAATIFSGLTYVSLAAIDVDSGITLTTHSAEVYILRSIDPESAFIEDPASLSDVIDGAVDAWLTANGTSLSHRLLRLENDTIYANVAINATVKKGYKWTYLAGDNVTVTADADYNAISFLTSDDDSEYVRAKITGTGIGTSEIQTIYYMDSDGNVLDTISDYAFDDGMIEVVVPDRTAEIRFTALADDNPIVTGVKHALSNTVNEIQEEINRLSDDKVNLNYGENHAAQFLVTNAIGSVTARALEAVVDGKVIRVRSPQEYADGSHDKYLEIDLSGVIPEAGATAEQVQQITANQNAIAVLQNRVGVSDVEETETGLLVTYTNGDSKAVEVGSTGGGGLAFSSWEYDEEFYLHLYDENMNDVIEPVYIPGGGGGVAGPVMRLSNLMSSLSIQVMDGADCVLRYKFTSTEDGEETGPGTAQYYVGGILRATATIQQGENSFDCTKWLASGESNTVKITVTDNYGTSRSLTYTVTSITIYHTDTFDDATICTGDLTYRFTAYGTASKIFHATIDGVEVATMTIASSGRQTSVNIPKQVHGAHKLKTWLTTSVNDMEITGNVITHDVIWQTAGNTTPIIASPFEQETAVSGETIEIPWIVVDPSNLIATVSLRINGVEVSSVSVDRTQQVWTIIDYPVGEVTFSIVCGIAERQFVVQVEDANLDVSVTETGALLILSAAGRSNNESSAAVTQWPSKVGSVVGTLTDFNHRNNGWMGRYLRVSGAARVTIPLQVFATDFRSEGRTIEFEVAFSDVQDKDAPAISCMSGGIGLEVTAHTAQFASEQVSVSAIYGDNQRLRIAFAVESRSEDRLIRTFINGFCCGAELYPTTDNFAQAAPVDIVIGSDYCTMDVYSINVYDHCLTQYELEENYTATRDTNAEKSDVNNLNQIYTASGDISLEKVMVLYPAMVIIGDLPQSKGDKKVVKLLFYNPDDPNKNFTVENVTIDVQGTSSQFYPVKNYKTTMVDGYVLTDGLSEKVYCLKANYMDSSGKRNTGTANLMQSMYTEKTPPQEENEKLRTTIEGYSIVLFHAMTDTDTPVFCGLYDFNLDKSDQASFGFTDETAHQCWEVCNNTSLRCLFQSADFSDSDVGNDFEARFPEDSTDYSALQRFVTWIVSCNGDPEKFAAEQPQHINLHYLVVYCIMTQVLTMADSRAKNLFIACWSIGQAVEMWYTIFYDMDTMIGVNNEGVLAFDPGYESQDTIGTQNVFNGADSLLFQLAESAFAEEIAAEYRAMRSDGRLSVERLMSFYNADKLNACMALYNADGEYKYVQPLLTDGDGTHLYAYQGPGNAYFEWWLTESIAHFDSRWQAAAFLADYATLRLYTPSNYAGVTPNANMKIRRYASGYVHVKYGSYVVRQRVAAGGVADITAPNIQFNDTETIIYGASWLTSLGDLSPLYCGTLDVHMANRLAELIAGSAAEGYSNTNLTEVVVGNNRELLKVDVRNCPNLSGVLDLSGCDNIREIYTVGTAITGVSLPNGGYLETVQYDTPTSVIIRNHATLQKLEIRDYSKLATIWIEGKSAVDELSLVTSSPALARVRLTDMDWQLEDASLLLALSKLAGLDENGNNTATAIITGKVHLSAVGEGQLTRLAAAFPNLTITYDTLHPLNTVRFLNTDGTVLDTQYVDYGEAAADPVTRSENPIAIPTMAPDIARVYTFKGWSADFSRVIGDMDITATYTASTRQYTVRFLVEGIVVETQTVYYNESTAYSGDEPQKTAAGKFYLFDKWDQEAVNVAADMDINALFYESDMYPEQKAFSECNPAELYRISESGKASEYWSVGDTHEITLTTGEIITERIHAFDYYDLADGTGKAPVAVYPTGIINETGQMNSGNVNEGGFPASKMKTFLNDTWFYRLPSAYQKIIKEVVIKSSKGGGTSGSNNPYELVSCNCKVYIPSHAEVGFDATASPYNEECGNTVVQEDGTIKGVAFSCYTDNNSRIKRPNNNTGAATSWWLRSPDPASGAAWRIVNSTGFSYSNYASYAYGVGPGFSF